ncbi:MAG: hypothetical protein CEE38_08705 [Planctomycetes bacterium B3_Pla]|nr:MAG: hypothetical protein CEE38_08705 [Planctomycetes bacterium B3_Pla]
MCTNGDLKCRLMISVFLVVIECVTASGIEMASNPDPPDGACVGDAWVQLSWLPGDSALLHDLYFGDNYAEVDAAALTGGTYLGRQTETSFLVGDLVWGKTYYWRVDEFDGLAVHRSDVWRFAVGSTLFVDIDAAGANNGSNWTDAFNHLQDALAVTHQCDTQIWIAEGTYKPDQGGGQTPGDRKATFQLITDVSIYGGFKGDETSLEQRDWFLHETILSGDLNGDDVAGSFNEDNTHHVVTGSGTSLTAVMDGFTIMHGNAWSEEYAGQIGGGMLNEGGSPTIGNCRFIMNSARNGGGMSNHDQSSPKVYDCTFLYNNADYGSGMHNGYSSNPDVTRCTFTENRTFVAGGMANLIGSNPDVSDCIFIRNWANRGGGMYNGFSSSPTVFNCMFLRNSADDGSGGMYIGNQCNPKLTNCTFVENSAVAGATTLTFGNGGAIEIMNAASAEVINCTFIQNSAVVRYGGAVYAKDSDSVFINCTFMGNSAPLGGAVCNAGVGLVPSNKHITLTNCILWDNTAVTGPQIALVDQAELSIDFCDLEGSQSGMSVGPDCTVAWGTGMISASPLFTDSDGRLSAGSPCIDAGDNIPVPAGILFDLDGMQRFVDDPLTADTGAGTRPIVDMGAYEFDPSLAVRPFCSKQGSDEIFAADFESDPAGSPPAPSTPGYYGPVGASLETSGDVEVIDSAELGSKAIKITRSSIQAEINAIVGDISDAPYTRGVYYIDYAAHGLNIPETTSGAMRISVRATDNKPALSLLLYDGAYYLAQVGPSLRLTGSYDPSTAHRVHIELDLDMRRYSVCIDGEVLASNIPLIASTFIDLHSLRFNVFPTDSPGFESENVIDDIRITK